MDTSRQRVLARGGTRRGRPGAAVERPPVETVTAAYVELARTRVVLGAQELEAQLATRFGLPADDELLLDAGDEAMLDPSSPITLLAPEVVVHAPELMAGAVLTHRLTAEEREGGFLVLDVDLAGFVRVPAPHVGDEHLDVDDVDGELSWIGPEDWLAALPADALLAVRVTADGGVELSVLDADPVVPPDLLARVRTAYEAELDSPDEPGLPVSAENLVLGARVADRAVFASPVPPLSELAAAAGLERRGPEFAHAESVWAAGEEADRHWRLIDRLGTDGAATTALEALDLLADPAGDPGTLRRALELLQEPDVLVAVTEELLVDGDAERLAAYVVLADRMVAAAGTSPRAAVARWMAAAAAERDGRVLDAESHLRAACSEAEGWPFVEDRLAWYESDRGHAAAATGRWRSIGTPDDDPDLAFAARAASGLGAEPGRNEPCWCGSGRKYKQCHSGRPMSPPLAERVGWLWRKSIAYLERRGGTAEEDLIDYASWRAGDAGDLDAAYVDPFTADAALHEGGWFAQFLTERGPLLPADEAALGASWLDADRALYEVLAVRPGDGLDVRDRRGGEAVTITERTASTTVEVGALLCARAVPDGGGGHRFVGAVLPVPPAAESDLRELL
ncbi:SEC-C metal-binding domain-containing protein, partial [Pseudonocardia abyssalis]